MDFLKKHHEKIVLALALLVLIGTAGYLAVKVETLTKVVQNDGLQPPRRSDIKPVDLSDYRHAIAALSSPFLWTHPASNMFGISPFSAPPIEDTGKVVKVSPLELVHVQSQQFKLLFRAYNWDAEAKQGRNFQINFLSKNRTFFVAAVGESIPDPAEINRYALAKFERKIVMVDVPGIGKQERDVSELTLQRAGEEPIILVLDRITAPNPVAVIRCRRRPDEPITVKRGEVFDCAGMGYKVVDIDSKQVLILHTKTGEETILTPSPTTP